MRAQGFFANTSLQEIVAGSLFLLSCLSRLASSGHVIVFLKQWYGMNSQLTLKFQFRCPLPLVGQTRYVTFGSIDDRRVRPNNIVATSPPHVCRLAFFHNLGRSYFELLFVSKHRNSVSAPFSGGAMRRALLLPSLSLVVLAVHVASALHKADLVHELRKILHEKQRLLAVKADRVVGEQGRLCSQRINSLQHGRFMDH